MRKKRPHTHTHTHTHTLTHNYISIKRERNLKEEDLMLLQEAAFMGQTGSSASVEFLLWSTDRWLISMLLASSLGMGEWNPCFFSHHLSGDNTHSQGRELHLFLDKLERRCIVPQECSLAREVINGGSPCSPPLSLALASKLSSSACLMSAAPARLRHAQDGCLPEHEISLREHMPPGSSAFPVSHCEGN